jgi:hypothetical protein
MKPTISTPTTMHPKPTTSYLTTEGGIIAFAVTGEGLIVTRFFDEVTAKQAASKEVTAR